MADGEERIYTYKVSEDGYFTQLSARNCSDLPPLYRKPAKNRIIAALQANSSLLVVGEAGCGKTFLAEAVVGELESLGFLVAHTRTGTVKQTFLDLAQQLGVESESLEGKPLKTQELQSAIAQWLQANLAFVICDDAHRLPVSLRCWLEKLLQQGQPLLLLATFPPARDIFLKLPRLELNPFRDSEIRAIMEVEAADLNLRLHPGKMAELQQRVGGNPMLAKRVVREEYLGLDGKALDHTQWLDITPFILASLMCLVILRFLGLAFNSQTLYLLGGMLTIGIGVIRLLLYNLPRSQGKLGK